MTANIHETLMRGNSDIRLKLESFLKEQVPYYLDIMRSQNPELTTKTLPNPLAYNAVDPNEVLSYPTVGVYITGASNFTREAVWPSSAIRYRPDFDVVIFVATKTATLGTDEDGVIVKEKPYALSAMRQRDDILSAVVASLVNKPSLGTADDCYGMRFNEDTIEVSTPPPAKAGNNSNPDYICSGTITATISAAQDTVLPTIGIAEDINVIIRKIELEDMNE